MAMLKHLGVVSVKAGRTLLYKAVDVVTMFKHWKTSIPQFISDMAQGMVGVVKIWVWVGVVKMWVWLRYGCGWVWFTPFILCVKFYK